MKALLLGAGGMGALAAKTLAGFDAVTQIKIADINLGAAEKVAAACGSKATAMALDVTDVNALIAALEGADLCLNLVGPFFRFGVPILRTTIESGTDYIDICDDPEPTLDMLGLNPLASEKGVTAIVGLGASPGVTNLLAALARRELSQCTDLTTAWSLDSEEGSLAEEGTDTKGQASAAIIHWLEQCSGFVKVWQDGALAEVKPLQPFDISIPDIGHRQAWTVGHPEAVTLPIAYPALVTSTNVMFLPMGLAPILKSVAEKIDDGAWTLEQAGQHLVERILREEQSLIGKGVTWLADTLGPRKPPPLLAQATGTKSDQTKTVSAYLTAVPPNGMAGITGIPLAIGAKLMGEGKGIERKHGVFAPEALVDPDIFFDELATYCKFKEGVGRTDQGAMARGKDLVHVATS